MFVNMAFQDWLLYAYFGTFVVALLFGSGPHRGAQLVRVGLDVIALSVGLVVTRGEILKRDSVPSAAVYRLTALGATFLSYFQLQHILPAVSSRALDAGIYELDMKLFGYEPALEWDRFVSPVTTEWFAFFYFGYFAILAAHVVPFVTVVKDQRLSARFALGAIMLFCIAHATYMLVPGFGPYRYFADRFEHPLEGPVFWRLVLDTVTANGAQKDIFPSLHTAAPTFFFLFSFRHRHLKPFKYTWPFLGFATSQIIIATMFLRWHYLIDIVAGIALATFAVVASTRIEAWEYARRIRLGMPTVFGPRPIGFTDEGPALSPSRG